MSSKESQPTLQERASQCANEIIEDVNDVIQFQGDTILNNLDDMEEMVNKRLQPILAGLGDQGPEFLYDVMDSIYPVGTLSPENKRGKLGGQNGRIAGRILGILANQLEPLVDQFGDLTEEVREHVSASRQKMRDVLRAERQIRVRTEEAKPFGSRRGASA